MTTAVHPLAKMKFWKIGADPEAVVYSAGKDTIISATNFCGGGAMSSRIGTDGHATTMEFRPSPSKSVLVVMSDLAEALLLVGKCLDEINQESPGLDLKIVSQAYFKQEPLGGHVHLSYKAARGFSLNEISGLQNTAGKLVHMVSESIMANYGDKSMAKRNETSYGANAEVARNQPGGSTWGRFEYRVPPTWLRNPLTAYCFLGAAKLAMLNLPKLVGIVPGATDFLPLIKELTLSEDCRELRSLPGALAKLRDQSYKLPLFVEFDKWAKFLNGG